MPIVLRRTVRPRGVLRCSGGSAQIELLCNAYRSFYAT